MIRYVDGSLQMPEQRNPGPSTCVAGRDHRDRQRPGYCEVRIIVCDGKVLGRIVRTVDPVAHVGSRSERLEAVQEARWDVQVPKIVVVEQESLLFAESWRTSSNVDQHVMYCTVGTADQFGLAAPRASMHAADNATRRAGLRVLHEGCGGSRPAEVVVEDVRVEGTREQAPFVAEGLWNEDKDVHEVRLFDPHRVMLP